MKTTGKILLSGAAVALIFTGIAAAQGMGEHRDGEGMRMAHYQGGKHGDGPRADGHRAGGGEMREGFANRGNRGDGPRGGGQMLRQMFETFDLDGDGSLTQEEIDTARTERLTGADTDGDGALSLAEYEALWLEAMRERMVDAFQQHDADGDGLVTTEEFNDRFDGIVARMDRNGDGALSPDDRPGRIAPRNE